MNKADFITLVEEVLEVDEGTVELDSSLEELDWDSLCNITFIAEIDSKLGKSISADDLVSAKTVSDLYALVS